MHLPRAAMPASGTGLGDDRLPPEEQNKTPSLHQLSRRENSYYAAIAPVAIVAIIAVVAVIFVFYINSRKRKQEARAKTRLYEAAPTDDEAETQQRTSQSLPLQTTTRRDNTTRNTNTTANASRSRNRNAASSADVDRQTSVRSVMTLPAYSASASNNERTLAREGERDGIDVIVNMATEEQAEALRDEEMAGLYQIRETRRRQLAEREERRLERNAARERRDTSALANINERTVAAADDTTVNELRQQVSQTHERRVRSVSSVSYADVGVARHDGSRVDVSNVDTENTGLLSDAASIGRTSREMTRSHHRRDMSAGSFVSVDSGMPSPAYPGSRSSSRVDVSRTTSAEQGLGSSPEMVEADLGDVQMPPPEYEEVSLADDNSPPQYAATGQGGSDDLQAPPASGRQRSSSYVGPLPEIRIGSDISIDLGDDSSRR